MTQKGVYMDVTTVLLLILISAIVITGLIFLVLSLIEPHKLNVTKETLSDNAVAGSPDLRILFFSDLHAEFCFIPKEKTAALIREEAQGKGLDAVIFGGDIVNNPTRYKVGAEYLTYIAETCSELGIPFEGVTGNHDVQIPADGIAECSFHNISGGYTVLRSRRDGSDIALSGICDSGRKHRVWYELPNTPDGCSKNIVIAHNPDQILHIEDCTKVDYMISGHIHGGQIRTPFKVEFKVLRKDTLPKYDVTAGTYKINGITLFISKGIGCVRLPMRLGAKPEINIIEI